MAGAIDGKLQLRRRWNPDNLSMVSLEANRVRP